MSRSSSPIVCLALLSLLFISAIRGQQEHGPANNNDQARRQHQLGPALDGDDFHTNIDLSKMMDAHRYNLIDSLEAGLPDRTPSFESLASKLLPRAGYARTQYNGAKWPNYRPISVTKEDKDYTFVILPTNNDNDRRVTQDYASRASLWATDLFRDLAAKEAQNR